MATWLNVATVIKDGAWYDGVGSQLTIDLDVDHGCQICGTVDNIDLHTEAVVGYWEKAEDSPFLKETTLADTCICHHCFRNLDDHDFYWVKSRKLPYRVDVYHSNFRNSKNKEITMFPESAGSLDEIGSDNVKRVARVRITAENRRDAMRQAWKLTNSYEQPWYTSMTLALDLEFDNFDEHKGQKVCRSSMVGDIFRVSDWAGYIGDYYVVSHDYKTKAQLVQEAETAEYGAL